MFVHVTAFMQFQVHVWSVPGAFVGTQRGQEDCDGIRSNQVQPQQPHTHGYDQPGMCLLGPLAS